MARSRSRYSRRGPGTPRWLSPRCRSSAAAVTARQRTARPVPTLPAPPHPVFAAGVIYAGCAVLLAVLRLKPGPVVPWLAKFIQFVLDGGFRMWTFAFANLVRLTPMIPSRNSDLCARDSIHVMLHHANQDPSVLPLAVAWARLLGVQQVGSAALIYARSKSTPAPDLDRKKV